MVQFLCGAVQSEKRKGKHNHLEQQYDDHGTGKTDLALMEGDAVNQCQVGGSAICAAGCDGLRQLKFCQSAGQREQKSQGNCALDLRPYDMDKLLQAICAVEAGGLKLGMIYGADSADVYC